MGRELEFKYTATPEIQAQLAARFIDLQLIRMQTTYYDTSDGRLAAARCTLRLRQENGRSVCTLKSPLPDGSRAEWEQEAATLEEGLQKIPQAAHLADLELIPVCGARFTRLACTVSTGDGSAELALDRGILTGGGKEIPLCEVEIEYKSGSEAAAGAFALRLAAEYGLQPEEKSKFARAMALAEGGNHG